VRSSRF